MSLELTEIISLIPRNSNKCGLSSAFDDHYFLVFMTTIYLEKTGQSSTKLNYHFKAHVLFFQDVLHNDSLKLDWMFQMSISSDIARVCIPVSFLVVYNFVFVYIISLCPTAVVEVEKVQIAHNPCIVIIIGQFRTLGFELELACNGG